MANGMNRTAKKYSNVPAVKVNFSRGRHKSEKEKHVGVHV